MKFYIHLNFSSRRFQDNMLLEKMLLKQHYDRLGIPEDSRLFYFHKSVTLTVTKDIAQRYQNFFKKDNNLYVDICMSNMLKSDLVEVSMSRLHQILQDCKTSDLYALQKHITMPIVFHESKSPT